MPSPKTPWSTALRYAALYWIEFLKVLPTRRGLFSNEGRTLIWGKIRRMLICMVPGLAQSLHQKHKVSGGCAQCGTSCKLLFTCPALDLKTNNCMVYDKRPTVCRVYPITPQDIHDRDIVAAHLKCGYDFPSLNQRKSSYTTNNQLQSEERRLDLAS